MRNLREIHKIFMSLFDILVINLSSSARRTLWCPPSSESTSVYIRSNQIIFS